MPEAIGFFPAGTADRLQALFVGEAGQRNLADGLLWLLLKLASSVPVPSMVRLVIWPVA